VRRRESCCLDSPGQRLSLPSESSGLTLIHTLLDADVVDEWCQTLSPKLGVSTPGLTAPDVGGSLSNVAHDADGYHYTRRRLGGAPQKR
jgi:hypothetical protein